MALAQLTVYARAASGALCYVQLRRRPRATEVQVVSALQRPLCFKQHSLKTACCNHSTLELLC